MKHWLDQIAISIQSNVWIAPLLALLAGMLTSFTPCSLSNIPLIIGYVGGVEEKNTRKAFRYSIIFAVGTAVTFITLGLIATSAGKLMGMVFCAWRIDGTYGVTDMGVSFARIIKQFPSA